MKKEITQELIGFTQRYENNLSDFPFKTDIVRLKEFELTSYYYPLIDLFVAKINDVIKKGDDINDYLPFIKENYRSKFLKEVNDYSKNIELKFIMEGREIEKNFMDVLLKYNTNIKKQEEEVAIFMDKNKEFYENIISNYPHLFLSMVAELRSPRIQYALVNSKLAKNKMKAYINSLTQYEFDTLLKENFMYPLVVDLDTYYKKWIGKNKVHVKFCKSILSDKYDYAKKAMKLAEKDKWISVEEGDGLFNESYEDDSNLDKLE